MVKILFGIKGQLLHSQKIRFIHPITKKQIDFEVKIPKEFQEVIQILEKEYNI